MKNYIALDIGGITTDGAVIDSNGKILIQKRIPSNENANMAIILKGWKEFLKTLKESSSEEIKGCGIGIPDPFDYIQGISLMEHKFKALYGINIKRIFEKILKIPVFFLSDAKAFVIGVGWKEFANEERLVGITLGTGLGCDCVFRNGQVPADPWIWKFPLENGILEDKISTRGIVKIWQDSGGEEGKKVHEIAELARTGDERALKTFQKFSEAIGKGLASACGDWKATRFVFGGQISKSFDLFGTGAQNIFENTSNCKIPFAATRLEHAALLGAAFYVMEKQRNT